ncbi:hypothetical protein BGW42_007862 [Actinomortierella wolfii]|nr:hypothetical protein BGW42_007862 [Actinomortierella wolfii]
MSPAGSNKPNGSRQLLQENEEGSPTDGSDTLVTKAQVYKDLATAFNKKRFNKPNSADVYETPESGNGIKTKVIDLIRNFEEAHTVAKKKKGSGSTDEATWQQLVLAKCRHYFALELAFGNKHSAEEQDVYADTTLDMSQPYPPGPDRSDGDSVKHAGTESSVELGGVSDKAEDVLASTGLYCLFDAELERSTSARPTRNCSASVSSVIIPSSGAANRDDILSMSGILNDILTCSREMAKAKADMVLIERERVAIERERVDIERMRVETERRRMEEKIRLKEKELEMHFKLEIEEKRMELEYQLKLRSAEKIVLLPNEVAIIRGLP